MYRIRYEITQYYLNQDNYSVFKHYDDGYLYGDTVEDIKKKCIDFTIDNKYTEQLDTLGVFELNKWMIDDNDFENFKTASEEFDYGNLSSEWKGIIFSDIEIIPKTISFNFKEELQLSDKYKEIIKNGETFIKKTIKDKKRNELKLAKKQYEKKLKEISNEI